MTNLFKRVKKRWDDYYRRNLALSRDNWKSYTRVFPFVVEFGLGNLSHPIWGPLLRRLFRFSGEDSSAQSFIVPIDRRINFGGGKNTIMPAEKLRQAIMDSSYRVIMNRCICRDSYKCVNFPRDFACIMLGEACRTMVGRGVARYATVEEALAHLERACELGLVATCAWTEMESIAKGIPEENKKKYFEICLCCPCCCNGLKSFKEWYRTDELKARFRSSSWRPKSNPECIGCGICANICPMDAITVGQEGIVVGEDCLGCGLCAAHCPNRAIVLEAVEPMKEHLLDYFQGMRPQITG